MTNFSAAEGLRRFEQSLVPVRAVAGADESFAAYAAKTLPADLEPAKQAKIQQGFEAGYAAAMDRVRSLLVLAQGEALTAARTAEPVHCAGCSGWVSGLTHDEGRECHGI